MGLRLLGWNLRNYIRTCKTFITDYNTQRLPSRALSQATYPLHYNIIRFVPWELTISEFENRTSFHPKVQPLIKFRSLISSRQSILLTLLSLDSSLRLIKAKLCKVVARKEFLWMVGQLGADQLNL